MEHAHFGYYPLNPGIIALYKSIISNGSDQVQLVSVMVISQLAMTVKKREVILKECVIVGKMYGAPSTALGRESKSLHRKSGIVGRN